MKHIPFADFPRDERAALLAALQRTGVAARHVCVSRVEPSADSDDGLLAMAMISAPRWLRVYETGEGWIALLEQDLRAAQTTQCGFQNGWRQA
jgi:hypothetical protein